MYLKLDFERFWFHMAKPFYSGDLKSEHSTSGNMWKPDFFKDKFWMVWFSNGWAVSIYKVPTIWKWDHSKFRLNSLDLNGKGKMAVILYNFQISDPIQNPDHLQTNLFSTIWNPRLVTWQTISKPNKSNLWFWMNPVFSFRTVTV